MGAVNDGVNENTKFVDANKKVLFICLVFIFAVFCLFF